MRSTEYLRAIEQMDPDALFATLKSWRAVVRRLADHLAAKRDLVLESTLSGKTVLKHLHDAKSSGYELHLTFIGTESPEINILRVAERRALGGHYVSEADIRRRWHTSLANLPSVMDLADSTLLLDNSLPQEHARGAFQTVAKIQNGKLDRASETPSWARAALPALFIDRTR